MSEPRERVEKARRAVLDHPRGCVGLEGKVTELIRAVRAEMKKLRVRVTHPEEAE